MSEDKPMFEKGDKIHVMSTGAIGFFVKVYQAQNIEGEKQSRCSILLDGKEKIVDMYDIELLQKVQKPPKSISAITRPISRSGMSRWVNRRF